MGPLAQLARASGLHPEGHRFEPGRAHKTAGAGSDKLPAPTRICSRYSAADFASCCTSWTGLLCATAILGVVGCYWRWRGDWRTYWLGESNLTRCGLFFTVELGPPVDSGGSVVQVLEHVVLEEFVVHVVVQRLRESAPPWLAGWDQRLECFVLAGLSPQSCSDEVRSIISV